MGPFWVGRGHRRGDRKPWTAGQTVRTERQPVICSDRQLDSKGSGSETSAQPVTEYDVSQVATHAVGKPPATQLSVAHTVGQTL